MKRNGDLFITILLKLPNYCYHDAPMPSQRKSISDIFSLISHTRSPIFTIFRWRYQDAIKGLNRYWNLNPIYKRQTSERYGTDKKRSTKEKNNKSQYLWKDEVSAIHATFHNRKSIATSWHLDEVIVRGLHCCGKDQLGRQSGELGRLPQRGRGKFTRCTDLRYKPKKKPKV